MRTRDENKENNLLQEALQMIVREGFDGLSMQKLAKAAGVSPATIYIYFKDRDDLILQLYKREVEKYFDYVLQGFDPEMSFAEGMRVQWKRRAAYVLRHPAVGHFMEHMAFTPLSLHSQGILDPKFNQVMSRFSQKAIDHGELVEMPFEMYWSIAFSPLINLIKMHKAGKGYHGASFVLTDDILERTLHQVLKALQP
ncbi:transcriptional regulator, TetR family [Chitinophaga costaii]|uniref:Transcriptional regulator, TetR family n=1 Tax=Chitinophaga costaii TaxID=1335309 RepID=A0A1C4E7J9_9BACT|nr:TetR/AcrR family transcriptional regulator [Chitinophaga costaii]PUZ24265.1 TetR/AcrR family transcriptional regulator [Chitinophaga costaii]SCC39616.1 transcriptional regulator, TetR family [Chitinophaga costaii]